MVGVEDRCYTYRMSRKNRLFYALVKQCFVLLLYYGHVWIVAHTEVGFTLKFYISAWEKIFWPHLCIYFFKGNAYKIYYKKE